MSRSNKISATRSADADLHTPDNHPAPKTTGLALRKFHNLVVRPIILGIVFLAVLLAVVQASGRIAMFSLHLFEDDINHILAQVGIQVVNLQGDWRGFNPVVTVDKAVSAPAFIEDVSFELDFWESLLHSSLVGRVVKVESVVLHMDKTQAGWTLRGLGQSDSTFDVSLIEDLVLETDLAEVNVSVHFNSLLEPSQTAQAQDVSHDQKLNIVIKLANLEQSHSLDIQIVNPEEASKQLNLSFQQLDQRFGQEVLSQKGAFSGELLLPSNVTGMEAAVVSVGQSLWQGGSDSGDGQLSVNVDGLVLPNVENQFELSFTSQWWRLNEQITGLVKDATIQVTGGTAEENSLHLKPVVVGLSSQQSEFDLAAFAQEAKPQPELRLWVNKLDLSQVSLFIDKYLQGLEPAARWVKQMAVRGEVKNLHVFVGADEGFGYSASFSDLSMRGYKGAPTVNKVDGAVWGNLRSASVQLNGQDVFLQFPDLYHNHWLTSDLSGVMSAFFAPGYFALEGSHLKANIEGSAIAGRFSLTRPNERYEQRVALSLSVDTAGLLQSKSFIPYKIPDELAQWLSYGPIDGTLHNARFVYQGQVHTKPNDFARRIELLATIEQGVVRYARDWPIVSEVFGTVHAAGVNTRIRIDSGVSEKLILRDSNMVLFDNSAYAQGYVRASGDGQDVLGFVRNSPLIEQMSFVSPSWSMHGLVDIDTELLVPLKEGAPELKTDLRFTTNSVELDLPEYRSNIKALKGSGQFTLPYLFSGEFSGQMFTQDAKFRAYSGDGWVNFDIEASATPEDVYQLIGYTDTAPVRGIFDFTGTLSLPVQEQVDTKHSAGIAHLTVNSSLEGLAVGLPGVFGKTPQEIENTEIDVQFLSGYQAVRWDYKSTHGWLHYGETIERGAIGINSSPPMTSSDTQAIAISGHLSSVNLQDWVSDSGESSVALPLDWMIQGLRVDKFLVDELAFENLLLSGVQKGEEVEFSFKSNDLTGQVHLPESGPLNLNLQHLNLPNLEESDVEGLSATNYLMSVETGKTLPHALVNIDHLTIAGEEFGRWAFTVEPKLVEGEVASLSLRNFKADVLGVHINDGLLDWVLATNESSFNGLVTLDNLLETMPKWDYPAALQTGEASVDADAQWNGSPLDVNLLGLRGYLDFIAKDGRFFEIDAGPGGLRMLSLVNFSKAAKRISFDFSDVVGEGISFDDLSAKVRVDDGLLQFVDRMQLKGSSGSYQLGGVVDMKAGILDNEMIVTLPVSNSLPWYGFYLALANPLAGLGVIVGERVLRKPIEQFSSAKFSITGKLEDPQVTFVSLWDQSMKERAVEDIEVEVPDVDELQKNELDVGDVNLQKSQQPKDDHSG